MQNGHLNFEEIEQLSEQKGPAENQAHIGNCRQCHVLLEKYQAASAKLDQLASVRIGAKNGMNCPDERIWFDVAAGTLSSEESLKHVQHAAECDNCGRKLKNATHLFDDNVSAEEEQVISSIPSANRDAQKKLAARLAGRAEGKPTPQIGQGVPKRRGFFSWRLPGLVFAGLAIVAFVAFVGRSIHLKHEIGDVERLVASEYQKGRPMQYRVAGVPYGPFLEERGNAGILPSIEVPAEAKHPLLAAQAALLERDTSSAIKVLEAARKSGQDSSAVMDNLVVAYAIRAEQTRSDDDYKQALQVSDEILRSTPSDPIVYFNRALIFERMYRSAEAQNAAQQFLSLERDPNWRGEAEKIGR